MDDALGNFAPLEHRLVGCFLVDHVDSCQHFVLIFVELDCHFVESQQNPSDFDLRNRVFEGIEKIFLLEQVEGGDVGVVFELSSAVSVNAEEVLSESWASEGLDVPVDDVEENHFLSKEIVTVRCLSVAGIISYLSMPMTMDLSRSR